MSIKIETDISVVRNNMSKNKTTRTGRTRVIGEHTLTYDSIHNTKFEGYTSEEEEYIIQDGISVEFNVDNTYDTSSSYDSNNYQINIELNNQVYDYLEEYTDIIFSADTRRRIPSPEKLNDYFSGLLLHLNNEGYSHTEIFTTLSTFFTDNIWNVYKKLDKKYKDIIFNELKEKYHLNQIDDINFL